MTAGELILTRREKFAFSVSGKSNEAEWLADIVSRKTQYPIQNRSGRVLRWLEYLHDSGKWPEVAKLNLLSKEHLISPEDILTGKDSIQQILKRTQVRSSYTTQPLASLPEWADEVSKSIRLLNTSFDLVRHGMEMEVCLDRDGYRERYIHKVRSGESFILRLSTNAGKSTAELDRNLRIIQHTGHKNKTPARRNTAILYAFINRVAKKYNLGSTLIISPPRRVTPVVDAGALNYFRYAIESEAARLNALNEINRYSVELYRAQVDAEAARINALSAAYRLQVENYQAQIALETARMSQPRDLVSIYNISA